ncbi:MAG: hypothetical protein DRQ56_02790 [Gammaproteobacteria bacterium]|nr:MAG: hypothetical protein DRQ56_02790 [Gammaproteobacteria bacterium]
MTVKRFLVAFILATFSSGVVLAEEAVVLEKPAPRQGYFIGGSLGFAYGATRMDDTWYPPWSGSSVRFYWGQEIFTWVDLGLIAEYVSTSGKRRGATGGGLGLALQFHPVEPWLFRVEAGLGGLSLSDKKDTSGKSDGAYGDVYTFAVGYEFYPFYDGPYDSGAFGFAPVVALRMQPGDDMFLTVWIGVELKWWSGLPKNQLALPVDEAFSDTE